MMWFHSKRQPNARLLIDKTLAKNKFSQIQSSFKKINDLGDMPRINT